MGKKVSIVFEEASPISTGVQFKVYIEGLDDHRRAVIDAMTPEEKRTELSTAEFWALSCFNIVADVLKQSGALTGTQKRGKSE